MASDAKPISATPAPKQIVEHDGVRYTTIKEGLAHILVPEQTVEENAKLRNDQGISQVFYNPIQQFNRDLTVLTIKAYGKERFEHKALANRTRENKADKKRKRKEGQTEGEPPAKSPRLDGAEVSGGTAENRASEGTADATGEVATDKVVEEPVEDGNTEDTQAKPQAKENTGPRFTILDALSASGLRALRYAHEIPFVTSVTSNDLLKSAVESIKLNVQHNGLESKINVSHDDALAHMYTLIAKELRSNNNAGKPGKPRKSDKYDVVDLDPYGTAAPFLDAAVQSVRDDGGLLCVTCTDSGVWASNGYPEKCYSLYGGVPLKGWHSHEVGLRIILHAIETSAAKYGLAIEPLLSLSIDFYIRVFVRIRKSPATVKFQGGKNMVVYSCDTGCGAWTTQPIMRNKSVENKKGSGTFFKHVFAQGPTADRACEHCGSTTHLTGPMYAGRLHSPTFVQRILAELNEAPTEIYGTTARLRGMLQTALEEYLPTPEEDEWNAESEQNGDKLKKTHSKDAGLAVLDPSPFYFFPHRLAGTLHCVSPPENAVRGALKGLGYRVTRSHCKPGSIKTDAPWSIILHIMREWVRQKKPVTVENIKPGSAAYRVLRLGDNNEAGTDQEGQEPQPEVVFDEELGRDPTKGKLVRYPENPTANWGPMNRAKGK
ncbi:hypothetical protein OQA88_13117 [Cercophora sp. LCS_1]